MRTKLNLNDLESKTHSKTLRDTDESAKRLVINLLNGSPTYGIDIDTIFKTKSGEWLLIEFLKCESKFATPKTSHPRRYWRNWRKFVKLWDISKRLKAQLILINYEEKQKNNYGDFKVMYVDMNIKPSRLKIIETTDKIYNFEEFKEFYMAMNDQSNSRIV
jgi:hypothetical protein|tara:strand:- start:45 stop:527 length:483 start_codon:yes stop_codon:yes gene_type:complete